MADDSARLICINTTGQKIVEFPVGLHMWRHRSFGAIGHVPLDSIAEDSHANTVAAFLAGISDGYASTVVELADSPSGEVGAYHQLHAFDARSEHGCMVFVLTPTDERPDQPAPKPQALPVRRCLSRLDHTGARIWVDENFERVLGYPPEEAVGASATSHIHPDDVERTLLATAELLQNPGLEQRVRVRVRHYDGHWLWLELTRTNLLHTSNPHILNDILDISAEMAAQIALEEREVLLGRLTEALPIGVVYFTESDEITLVNDKWQALTGSEPAGTLASLVEKTFENAASLLATLDADREERRDSSVVVQFTSPSAGRRHGHLRRQFLRIHEGLRGLGGSLLTLDDITESFDVQREQARQARTDHLTQSLNRMGIEEQIVALLGEATMAESQMPLQLLYFDLDGFKSINDTRGHSAGDALLQTTVKHIQSAVRADDFVGRLGGDEFVAVLQDLEAGHGAAVAERIQETLLNEAGISVSVGLAVAEAGDDFDSLVGRADQSMYRDKAARSGRQHLS